MRTMNATRAQIFWYAKLPAAAEAARKRHGDGEERPQHDEQHLWHQPVAKPQHEERGDGHGGDGLRDGDDRVERTIDGLEAVHEDGDDEAHGDSQDKAEKRLGDRDA